jgi:hypothetical protein
MDVFELTFIVSCQMPRCCGAAAAGAAAFSCGRDQSAGASMFPSAAMFPSAVPSAAISSRGGAIQLTSVSEPT